MTTISNSMANSLKIAIFATIRLSQSKIDQLGESFIILLLSPVEVHQFQYYPRIRDLDLKYRAIRSNCLCVLSSCGYKSNL